MTNFPTDINDIEIARKRLRYRSWHRGTKELDYILGHYIDAHVAGFDRAHLARFEQLFAHEETDLQQWLMGQKPMPQSPEGDLLAEIRLFHLKTLAESDTSR